MTAKELKKLRRSDLLEMLLELRKENEKLKKELLYSQQQLENREIAIANAGSLAEAALRLNQVFEAAQAACEQYTENIHRRMEIREQETKEKCDAMIANAKRQAGTYDWLSEIIEG